MKERATMQKQLYPILEFDDDKNSITYRSNNDVKDFPEFLIITFFQEAVKKLLNENKISEYFRLTGENDLVLYKFTDSDILLMPGVIGCPATGGFLDEITAYGIKKVMFCGGGGVLDRTIKVGELLVVEGAIRDEGFSYHYLPPSRIVETENNVVKTITAYLENKSIPYLRGLVWTTDAFFRETPAKIKLRKSEGAKIVEMEQAGCLAVSKFRGIKYGAIIYGGDDVSGEIWDKRAWNRHGIRYGLIDICKDLVKLI